MSLDLRPTPPLKLLHLIRFPESPEFVQNHHLNNASHSDYDDITDLKPNPKPLTVIRPKRTDPSPSNRLPTEVSENKERELSEFSFVTPT